MCSPDGSRVAVVRESLGSRDEPVTVDLAVVDLDSGEVTALAPDLDLWPANPVWLHDGSGLLFSADQAGHRPIFRVSIDDTAVERLTDAGAYRDVSVTPDGERLFAMKVGLDRPPHPVTKDATPGAQQHEIPSPATGLTGPGAVERVSATADDGVEVGSWLVLPPADQVGEEPLPLAVMIHGGPLGSWNEWHWRWSPHVLAARGSAVLLPDPALSTGYGQDFIARGWGRWGEAPYTDLMSAIEAVAARDDIDGDRVAATGGSFGGYMANWIAGHTDRFRAIVTHASLWHLEGFHGTTDYGALWEREFGDPYADPIAYREQSPREHVGAIVTPMLVIHGAKDYRVPLSEALQLWTDLSRHGVEAQFLYYPDENHWILTPQKARLWYSTVLAFLDHHVLGAEWERPDLL